MRQKLLLLLIPFLLVVVGATQETPDWAKRDFDAPAQRVFAAALKSIQGQKHEVKSSDEARLTVDFHVGITAWSWGYNMRLTVTPISENRSSVTVGILRSGGKALSWGSGKKEVRKIMSGIDAELLAVKTFGADSPDSGKNEPALCTLILESTPSGADVELDGKFVGSTPTSVRLPAGDYEIRISKQGFESWLRKLHTLPGNELTVRAELPPVAK